VLEIVIEEVIGWDIKEKAPRKDVADLFGVKHSQLPWKSRVIRRFIHIYKMGSRIRQNEE
jgi:hypothetical protein